MNLLELLVTTQIIVVFGNSATLPDRRKSTYATPPTPLPAFLETAIASSIVNCPPSITRKSVPQLTPQLMTRALTEKGGRLLPSYMAADEKAAADFPNLLSFADSTEDLNDTLQFDPVADNIITKTKLLEDLKTWTSKPSTSTSISNHSTTHRINSSDSGVQKCNMTNTSLQVFESVSSHFEYLTKTKQLTGASLSDFMKVHNITVHPYILRQFHLGSAIGNRRSTRSADGASTTEQFCNTKGTGTANGFLRMCTACAATTLLTADKFPRYINEVICKAQDLTCLTVRGTPHGACRQSYIHIKLLRRRPGGCRMMIENGQEIVVGEWETYTQRIRSGCECFIDQRSLFAKYVVGK